MNYWLMKSEPDVFSFDDLKKRPKKTEPWNGVRNYQARNFMRDEMQVGDHILFYHSSCEVPGVYGIAKVGSKPYPDSTQFDPKSEYYDSKSTQDNPRWFLVDVTYEMDLDHHVSLEELKKHKKLEEMRLLQRGNRLSILPVTREEFDYIKKLGLS
ncbi:EVE domain-containing protein [Peredibacter starrii]|uniref:EVE domain-containing protein n=1 Tax=Peredibacter starrii TaxID=28202 RepID=A0AAX4HKS2_9BACT|nr:EVE domain-containing protein [Peredibacter starrii]WPU63782.1 EVE domain-containing protein [Peredibacter starrii]